MVDSAPDVHSKALALPSAIKHALNMVPSPALDLHFQGREICLYFQYWLGVRIYMFEEGSRCPLCLAASDTFGDHYVGCVRVGAGSIVTIAIMMQFPQQLNLLL